MKKSPKILRQAIGLIIGAGIAGLVRFPEGVFVWGPHVAGSNIPVRSNM